MTINEQFKEYGVVPVVVLNDAKDALPLAKALVEGGLACAEVTFRTDAAEESIRLMSEAYPEMLVGAGTVLTIDQVNRAVKAGAKFIVSPGFDPEIVRGEHRQSRHQGRHRSVPPGGPELRAQCTHTHSRFPRFPSVYPPGRGYTAPARPL